MVELKNEVVYNYKINLNNLTKEQFEQMITLEKEFKLKSVKAWLVNTYQEMYNQKVANGEISPINQ